ncbi:predicted protein [Histoplasma capsulatum G186AR]|uniref:Uncharacterized protein n=1 Tax=Ajellomyces capsulatus (strain G186AR / H82 / ATCC MYA-2454 / RMSCC 2432) TaxID=447093 RepID=C0ND19_AJECG|nr:uncharacterized protein HCBG_01015 [Histoplasma capsulatum G186AR]EEH11560.1 predicted protein [Histoplasma capsulatum G186AR]
MYLYRIHRRAETSSMRMPVEVVNVTISLNSAEENHGCLTDYKSQTSSGGEANCHGCLRAARHPACLTVDQELLAQKAAFRKPEISAQPILPQATEHLIFGSWALPHCKIFHRFAKNTISPVGVPQCYSIQQTVAFTSQTYGTADNAESPASTESCRVENAGSNFGFMAVMSSTDSTRHLA